MSLCLILQNKDSVFIGADTAISVFNGNEFVRESNDGKKLFEMGKDIVYCSGDMSYVPDIIKNMRIKNGYVDVEHTSKYLKGKNFRKCPVFNVISICVIICRVVGSNSYVYMLEPENDFDVVTHIGKQEGIQIWVGGIYNEKCLEIATEELKSSHRQAINTYINTYKRMACEEIGGYLNTYYLNSNGYRKIIDNYNLNDGYKPSSLSNVSNYGVVAQAIVGNMIAGNNLNISNENGSVIITGEGIEISNGVIKSSDYDEKKGTGSIINLRDGTFSFADGGLTYNDKSKLTVKGKIEATSIHADGEYSINYNNYKIPVLCGYRDNSQTFTPIWSVRLQIEDKTYIELRESSAADYDKSEIDIKADTIRILGNAYSQTGQIITSDRNAKDNIAPLSDKHMKLFSLLQPVSFTFIDGESGRTHIGFISQDVENAMDQAGLTDLDFAGFCKKIKSVEIKDENGNTKYEIEKDKNGNPVYIYSLRYEEFIALNTFMIQNLYKEVRNLQKDNQALYKDNQDIKERIEKLEKWLNSLES